MKLGTSPIKQTMLARLVIADDHELARAGLLNILAGEPGLDVCGEAANGHQAVQICRRLQPDLVILDAVMPEMDGLAATYVIKRECENTRVMLMALNEDSGYLFEALKAGAAGFFLKDATRQEIVSAVRQVLRGEVHLDSELALRMIRRLAGSQPAQPVPPAERLTGRETDVLRLLAQGKTNRQIAQELCISVGTTKVHVEHIISKLGVADRTQAAVRALELGILTSAFAVNASQTGLANMPPGIHESGQMADASSLPVSLY